MHKCHRLIQMKEEVFFDERHCAQECLQAIMLVHTKLNVIQRTIRIDKKKWPGGKEADLKPLGELLEAVGDLDLRNEVLTLVLGVEEQEDDTAALLAASAENAKKVRKYMKDIFYEAIDKKYGKGWGEVLFADPFFQDTLIPLVAWPGHRTRENLYILYCNFLRCPRFEEYQQRQVRVYCNFFPLSTRIVAHFCLTSPGQAKPEGPVPYEHIAEFGDSVLIQSDVDYSLGHNDENCLQYEQGIKMPHRISNLVLLATILL